MIGMALGNNRYLTREKSNCDGEDEGQGRMCKAGNYTSLLYAPCLNGLILVGNLQLVWHGFRSTVLSNGRLIRLLVIGLE
ncbi:hypothetical protein SLE2022_391790 [Rubroshorea leprosula]